MFVPLLQGGESFFRSVLGSMETVYLNRNPTAKAVLELVPSVQDDRICYDHFAFRTFGVFILLKYYTLRHNFFYYYKEEFFFYLCSFIYLGICAWILFYVIFEGYVDWRGLLVSNVTDTMMGQTRLTPAQLSACVYY